MARDMARRAGEARARDAEREEEDAAARRRRAALVRGKAPAAPRCYRAKGRAARGGTAPS